MLNFPADKKIILFDGVCNLCNDAITMVIKNDINNHFVFSSLQSGIGKDICHNLKIDTTKTDSIVLYNPTDFSYAIKSTAALRIMKRFGSWWKLTQVFFLIPKPIRDLAYDVIAKNRYKWFGKKESCMIPTKGLENKFLD